MTTCSKPNVGVHIKGNLFAQHLSDLSSHATLIRLSIREASRTSALPSEAALPARPRVILADLDESDGQTFEDLRQIRHEHAGVPVIVLSSSLESNLAVELIKLGIADCLCLPAPPAALWRKVERAILQSGGPTLDSPLLTLLWDVATFPLRHERRRCFRSDTVADYPAYVTVVKPTILPKMIVKNLSILTDGCPGGFALVGSNVHAHALAASPEFRFVLEVPQYAKPIPGQGTMKRIFSPASAADPTKIIGVEYRIDDRAQETPVRQFWSESQRRVAASVRGSLPRIAV